MNITLWVLQVVLAAAFLVHGWLFLFPPPDMVEIMNASIAPAFRLFLGMAEVLAAVGSAITTAMLLVMATFVAYMRWKVKPILPRERR